MYTEKPMKLSDLKKRIIEIEKKISNEGKNPEDIEIFFDSEAREFNCHMVGISAVNYENEEMMAHKNGMIYFTTQYH